MATKQPENLSAAEKLAIIDAVFTDLNTMTLTDEKIDELIECYNTGSMDDDIVKGSFAEKVNEKLLNLHSHYLIYIKTMKGAFVTLYKKILKGDNDNRPVAFRTCGFLEFLLFSTGDVAKLFREFLDIYHDPDSDDFKEKIQKVRKLRHEEETIRIGDYDNWRYKLQVLEDEVNEKYSYIFDLKSYMLRVLFYYDFYDIFPKGDYFVLFDYVVNNEGFNFHDCFNFKILLNLLHYVYYNKIEDYDPEDSELIIQITEQFNLNLHKALLKCLTQPDDKWIKDIKEFLKENEDDSIDKNLTEKSKELDEAKIDAEKHLDKLLEILTKVKESFNKGDFYNIEKLLRGKFGYDCERAGDILGKILRPSEIFRELSNKDTMNGYNEDFFNVLRGILVKVEFKREMDVLPCGVIGNFPGCKKIQEIAENGGYDNVKKKAKDLTIQSSKEDIEEIAKKLGIKLLSENKEDQIRVIKEWLSQL